MADYVKWIRERVGREPVILNAAGAIIVDNSGRVLLQKRGDFKKESWGFPAGMMEIGETPKETTVREVFEETGLEVEIEKYLGTYISDGLVSYDNGDKCQIILFVFVCRIVGGTLSSDGNETVALEFFDPNARPALFRTHQERAVKDFLAGKQGVIS